ARGRAAPPPRSGSRDRQHWRAQRAALRALPSRTLPNAKPSSLTSRNGMAASAAHKLAHLSAANIIERGRVAGSAPIAAHEFDGLAGDPPGAGGGRCIEAR